MASQRAEQQHITPRATVNVNGLTAFYMTVCVPFSQKRSASGQSTEHLTELVYAYNSTPHSSTGYSPHYLFFGRDPVLPVDHLLGLNPDVEGVGEVSEWITEHHERLTQAFQKASERTEKEALRRRELRNAKASNTDLPVGAWVFLRNRKVVGRNKIQEAWDPEPHKVVKRLATGGHTYVVEPVAGGEWRTVNRSELLDSRELVADVASDNNQDRTTEMHQQTQNFPPGEDSEDDWEDGVYVMRTSKIAPRNREPIPTAEEGAKESQGPTTIPSKILYKFCFYSFSGQTSSYMSNMWLNNTMRCCPGS